VALCWAPAVVAQIVPPGAAPPAPIIPQPLTVDGVPTGTVANPLRVYGDDAPMLSGLDILSGLGLKITGQMAVEYNDNIARRPGDVPLSPRYNSRDDWSFRPNVSISAGRALGRQTLFVNGSVGRDYYVHNTRLNRDRMAINGGVNWALGVRCGGRVQGGYSQRGTQFGAFVEVVPSTQKRWSFQAGGTCRTATGLSANLNYSRYSVRNETDVLLSSIDRSFADVNTQRLSGGIGYPLGVRGEIGIQGQWQEHEYINQLLPNGAINGSNTYGANVFANYRLGSSLRLTGGLGRSWVRRNHGLADTFSGTTWNLGLNYIGPRLGANVSMGRSANGSNGGASNYSIGKFLNGSVNYRANDRLHFVAGYAHDNQDYHGFSPLPQTEPIRTSTMDRYFVGTDYRLNRILGLSLDYQHQRRKSEPGLFSYSANVVTLTARASF
jgi:hypothetical protein